MPTGFKFINPTHKVSRRRHLKVKEIIRRLEEDGWYLARTKGSHRQYNHPIKPGTVTIPGELSKDLAIGTLKSILRQAQLEDEE